MFVDHIQLIMVKQSSQLVLISGLSLACLVQAENAAGYNVILTIVIVEVIFSFLIGFTCILLSFNLFRALKDSPDSYTGLPVGEFPLSRGSNYNFADYDTESANPDAGARDSEYSPRDPRMGSFGSDAEMDFEGVAEGYDPRTANSNLVGVARTVVGYLRLW